MDEVEHMRCAKHVYLEDDAGLGDTPPGFRRADPDDLARMGLTQDRLEPEDSNFKAAVYMKDPAVWGENPDPEAVVAFRGSTPAEEDWQNNFAQDANAEAPYYRRAVQVGNQLALTGTRAHIVGHSLGGGLASAAQGGSGLTASTYNAAGLHPATVARYSGHPDRQQADPSKILAVRVQGEVLTTTQESGVLGLLANDAAGRRDALPPPLDEAAFERLKAAGKVDGKDDYATYLRGMDVVIDATEQRKRADEETLRACVGRHV